MKKIALTMCAIALATCGFAQKKNVSGAEGKLYDPVDLAGAKTMIEQAMADPTTANQAKTYWVAGQVYNKIYEDQDTKRQLNQQYDQKTIDEALLKSVDAYKKSYELELLPDEKGKIKAKYQKLIPGKLEKFPNYLVNAGLAEYNAQDYKAAVSLWSKYIDLADFSFMAKSNLKADSLYNEIKYYTINAASQTTGLEDLSIKYMEDLKNTTKYGQTMYEWLYGAYQKKGDQTKMVSVLKEAVNKYPSNAFFIGSLINYYLENKKDAEAVAYVDEAIAKDPKNPQYYLIKSRLFLQKEDFDKSIETAKQAISIDANNFEANFYCGLSIVKKAEKALDKANNIKDNAKYKAAKKMATDQFETAIPYLEKARSINPKDASNLNILKTSYYRIGNGAKYSEIDKELKAIQ